MNTSLIISTYNRPDALLYVLRSVKKQTVLPQEVVIADDGSSADTANLIRQQQKDFPVPLIHAFQEDLGFRLARVRNLGVTQSTGDYFIFIDGDLILHNDFVKSHLYFRKPGHVLLGSRVLMPTKSTQQYLENKKGKIGIMDVKRSHALNMINSTMLSRIFTRINPKAPARGCNFSLSREDYFAVNGFNEEFQGWGVEDSEFVWRLERSGMRKIKLRCCGVAFHLDHAYNNELRYSESFIRNTRLFKEVQKKGLARCQRGVDTHFEPAVVLHEH